MTGTIACVASWKHGKISWVIGAIGNPQKKWVYECWVFPAVLSRLEKHHPRLKDTTRSIGHAPRTWRVLDEGCYGRTHEDGKEQIA